MPAGFFLPTTPGTRFVTLGGAIANDVHGKNHHSAGNFGNSRHAACAPPHRWIGHDARPGDPMFHATIGGLGLTGVIAWAEFQAVRIPSSTLDAEDTAFEHVSDYFAIAAEKKETFEHTMAWIDCIDRGAQLGRGDPVVAPTGMPMATFARTRSSRARRCRSMPPGFALNPLSIRAFNSVRHDLKTMKAGPYKAHYEPFLYPLDAIADWNRLYGSKGFYQYQCVVPPAVAKDATISSF